MNTNFEPILAFGLGIWEMLLILVAALTGLGLPILIAIGLYLYFRNQNKNGSGGSQAPPNVSSASLPEASSSIDNPSSLTPLPGSDFRKGVLLLAIGLGLFLGFRRHGHGPNTLSGLGLVFTALGAAYFFLASKGNSSNKSDEQLKRILLLVLVIILVFALLG